ncbi:MAG: phosphoglycerate mutase family protein [bacterium]|nr:phosphoglycerate mutase family protein [Alphaproteobacteria bacterium]MDI1366345.1 phosphoglycerate mutase family protein [bacterium]
MAPVYVIRHGRPASTWGGAEDDPGLDEAGRQQAILAMETLMALPENERPRSVVSSPLRRCRETAVPMAQALGVEIIIDPSVGEIPTPADMPAADRPGWLRAAFGGAWSEIVGDLDYRVWATDVAAAVAKYPQAAVFSHFVALNAAVGVATGEARVAAFHPDHCSITRFEIGDGRLILREKGREAQSQVL